MDTDEFTDSVDIEGAVHTLKKHAARLGVSEAELLKTLQQKNRPDETLLDSDARSEITTIGEEFMDFVNRYINPLMRNPLMGGS